MRRKLVVFILITLGILSIIAVIWFNFWKKEPLSYGLIYLHPVGNWTHISRIHWLGSPSQFKEVSPFVESDFANISKAGYKSILFQTAIASYPPYPDDFNYTFLKQNVK
ncbi:MAG: hypothetical protein ACP5ER_03665 [Candidatus Bathyarchaeales archaeon]